MKQLFKAVFRVILDKIMFRMVYKKTPYNKDPRITIGRHTYGITYNTISLFKEKDSVVIGSFCSFAPEVRILASGEHNFNTISTFPFNSYLTKTGTEIDTLTKGPVKIGNDVWIGFRATILSGVTIGDGAVIGAGSIVTRDVPAYSIVCGGPAKVTKYRFSPETIEALLKIQWWNWENQKIINEIPGFYGDVDSFILKHLK